MSNYIKLYLETNLNSFAIDDTLYSLVSIDGIDASSFSLNATSNAIQDGSVVYSKKIERRYIAISADYRGDNLSRARREIISFFNPKNSGKLTVDFSGSKKMIEYEVSDLNIPMTNIHDTLNFTVELMCPNPFFKESVDEKITVANWESKFSFPLTIPENGVVFASRKPSVIVNVFNKGDVSTGMVIEFKAVGAVQTPSLINLNTQEFLKINRVMQAGEVITINTNQGNKKITSELNNRTTNIFNELSFDSTFLQLDLGDNLFRYDAESDLNNLEIDVYYNPRYLGV